MLRTLIRIAALTATMIVAGTSVSAAACSLPPDANALAGKVLGEVNALRKSRRLGQLDYNPDLSRSAQLHACDMAAADYFSHSDRKGRNVQARARDVGYRDCLIAENLAWGYRDPDVVVTGWENSPGHFRNMMLDRVSEFGIGIANSAKGPYWVLVLARPC